MYGELLAFVKRLYNTHGSAYMKPFLDKLKKCIERREYVELKEYLRTINLYPFLIKIGLDPSQIFKYRYMDTSTIDVVGPIAFPPWRQNPMLDFIDVMAVLDRYRLGIPADIYRLLVNMEADALNTDLHGFRALISDISVQTELLRLTVDPTRILFWSGDFPMVPPVSVQQPAAGKTALRSKMREYTKAADDIEAGVARGASRAAESVSTHVKGAADILAALGTSKDRFTRAARLSGRKLDKRMEDAATYLDTNSKHLGALGHREGPVAKAAMKPDMTSLIDDFGALDLGTSAYRGVVAPSVDLGSTVASTAAGEPLVFLFQTDYKIGRAVPFYKLLILVLNPRVAGSITADDIEIKLFLNISARVLSDYLIPMEIKRSKRRPNEFKIHLRISDTSIPVHRVIAKAYIGGVNEASISFDCIDMHKIQRTSSKHLSTNLALYNAIRIETPASNYVFDVYFSDNYGAFAKKYTNTLLLSDWQNGVQQEYLPGSIEYMQYVSTDHARSLAGANPINDLSMKVIVVLLTAAGLVCNVYQLRNINNTHEVICELFKIPAYNVRAYVLERGAFAILRVSGSTLHLDILNITLGTTWTVKIGDDFRPDEKISITRFGENGVTFLAEFAYWRDNEVFGCNVYNTVEGGAVTIERKGPIFRPARSDDAILYAYRIDFGLQYVVLGRYDRSMDIPGVALPETPDPDWAYEVRKFDYKGRCLKRFALPNTIELLVAAKHKYVNKHLQNDLQLLYLESTGKIGMLTCEL